MPQSLSARLAIAAMLFVCALALWRGRKPERLGAAAMLLNQFLYLLVYDPTDLVHPQWRAMAVDVLYFAQMAFISVRYQRPWARYAAAFVLLMIATHVALALDLRIHTSMEFAAQALWTACAMLALLFGAVEVIVEERRLRRAR